MANVNAPFGFKPIQSAVGAASNFEMVQGQILYSDTTKIFRGDPVKYTDTTGAYITQWTASTPVSQLVGIFWGCTYLSTAQGKVVQSQIWPGADVASTAQDTIVANIVPCTGSASPLLLVQSDSTGVAFADIGSNMDSAAAVGSTFTGQSAMFLAVTPATTATLPWRVVCLYGGKPGAGGFMGIQPSTTNPYGGSATGAYNWVIVRANVVGAGATGLSS